jgi:hypothetical protein
MKTKAVVVTVIALVLALLVGAVSAQDGGRRNRGRFDTMRELHDIVTEATGLTMQEIRQQVEDGATLAEVIEANGGNVDDVVTQVVAAITERVNEAQGNGNLTEERATEILENLEQNVRDVLNGEMPFMQQGGFGDGWMGGRNQHGLRLVNLVADATGLEREAVVTLVQDGATLAEVLTDNGVEVATFIDEQVAAREENLTAQVESGRISQEVADARLNLFRVELTDRLNRTVESTTE